MKKIGVFFLINFVSILAYSKQGSIQLTSIKLMNNLIEIKIPSHFSALLDHEIKLNYPGTKVPKVAFADSLRLVRLAFYTEKNAVQEAGVGAIKASAISDFVKEDLKLKELSNGIETIDGRETGYVEIMHKSPEKMYRYYFLTVYKGLILSGELISPKKGYKSWISIGPEIMRSLNIRE